MRTNKDFLNMCYRTATSTISKAQSVNKQLFFDFCYENPQLFVNASMQMANPALQETHDKIKTAYDTILDACDSLDSANLSAFMNQHQFGVQLRANAVNFYERNFTDNMSSYDRAKYIFPLKISMEISDGSENFDHYVLNIDIKDINRMRSKASNAILEKAECSNFYELLAMHGYFDPQYKRLLANPDDYGWQPIDVPVGLSCDVLDEHANQKIVNLVNTDRKINEALVQVKNHHWEWMKHTTIAKCKDDPVIWPVIERDPEVIEKINRMEERERLRKEAKEAELKAKREREAAARKAKLEAIERGEHVEEEKKEVDRSTANLIRGINRIGGN